MRSRVALLVIAVVLMGQGCALPGFSNRQTTKDGGVFRSDTHGQTWKQKSAGNGKNARGLYQVSIRTLVFDPRDTNTVIVGTVGSGIYRSTNAGDSWSATGMQSGSVSCIDLKPSDPDVVYAVNGSTVQKSIDLGKTWKQVYADSQQQTATCVHVDRGDNRRVFALTSGGKLLRSSDEGKSWEILLTLRSLSPRAIVQDDEVPGHLFIFSKTNGVFDVDLEAGSWQDLSGSLRKLPKALNLNDVAIADGETSVWTIATGYGLLQSFDRAVSWQPVTTLVTPGGAPIQNVVMNPKNAQEMFITIGTKLHYTSDGGRTWTVTSLPTTRLPVTLRIDPSNVDRMYFGTFLVQS